MPATTASGPAAERARPGQDPARGRRRPRPAAPTSASSGTARSSAAAHLRRTASSWRRAGRALRRARSRHERLLQGPRRQPARVHLVRVRKGKLAAAAAAIVAGADWVIHYRRPRWILIAVFDHPAHLATAGLVALNLPVALAALARRVHGGLAAAGRGPRPARARRASTRRPAPGARATHCLRGGRAAVRARARDRQRDLWTAPAWGTLAHFARDVSIRPGAPLLRPFRSQRPARSRTRVYAASLAALAGARARAGLTIDAADRYPVTAYSRSRPSAACRHISPAPRDGVRDGRAALDWGWQPPLAGAEIRLLFWWVALCALPACPRSSESEGVAELARVDAARTRRSFSRLENALEVPNLIDIQRRSFEWLVDTEKGGLRETIDDVSPIEDYTGNLAVVFEEIHFDEPVASDLRVPREGHHLRAPADRQGRVPEPRDR